MQVGPEEGERDKAPDPARRALLIDIEDPQGDGEKEQSEQMGPGQIVDGGTAADEQDDQQGQEAGGTAPEHVAEQDQEVGRDQHAAEEDHAFEAGPAVKIRKEEFREPFPGEPGGAGLGEREQIGLRDASVGADPIADADMPTGITIGKKANPPVRPGEEEPDDEG
jgi:hypothetical protein